MPTFWKPIPLTKAILVWGANRGVGGSRNIRRMDNIAATGDSIQLQIPLYTIASSWHKPALLHEESVARPHTGRGAGEAGHGSGDTQMRRICAAAIAAFIVSASSWAEPPRSASKNGPAANVPKAVPTRQQVAASLDQEQKAYLERLQFCTRLRQIAAESGDNKLLEKADYLETQATELYMRKTAPLKSIMQDVKAAEAHLEERRNNPTITGSAANAPRRAVNGRPIIGRE